MSALVNIFWSPVRCFRARLRTTARWLQATLVVCLHATVVSITAIVMGRTGQAMVAPALEPLAMAARLPPGAAEAVAFVSGMLTSAVAFVGAAIAVVTLGQLFAQSARTQRAVEFTCLAYVTQLPWALVTLLYALAWFDPPPLSVASSVTAADVPRVLAHYQSEIASTPVQLALRLVGVFFRLWFVAIQCAALYVVCNFTVLGAWAAGLSMGSVFVVIPWVWERLG